MFINPIVRFVYVLLFSLAISAPCWSGETPEAQLFAALKANDFASANQIFAANPNMNPDAQPMPDSWPGQTVLLLATYREQWDIVRTMLANNPHANTDAASAEGFGRGVTVLWLAAASKQWELVRTMLRNNPRANIDATPAEGLGRGATVLWFAAAYKQSDIVRTMLSINPHANIDAAPAEGRNRGETVLWYAAVDQQWDIVRTMLQNNPHANFEAAPAEGPGRGRAALGIISTNAPEALLKFICLGSLEQRNDSTNPFTGFERLRNAYDNLFEIFRRAAIALPDFNVPPVVNETYLDILPPEVRQLLALRLLREEDPILRVYPDKFLMNILMCLQSTFKAIDRVERNPDVAACTADRPKRERSEDIDSEEESTRPTRVRLTQQAEPPHLS